MCPGFLKVGKHAGLNHPSIKAVTSSRQLGRRGRKFGSRTRSWLRQRGVNGVRWSARVVERSGTGASREDTWVSAWLMFRMPSTINPLKRPRVYYQPRFFVYVSWWYKVP